MKKLEEIDNYGDLIAYATGGFLISYREYGSYQGDWLAVIEKNKEIVIYKGYYGSCGGCDFLQDRIELTDIEVKKYMEEDGPEHISFSTSMMPETAEELKALLPANTRIDYDEKWEDQDGNMKPGYVNLFEQLKRDRSTNLEYLEFRAREANG